MAQNEAFILAPFKYLNEHQNKGTKEYQINEKTAMSMGLVKRTINANLCYYTSNPIPLKEMSPYEKLITHGVTTMKVYDADILPELRKEMLETINNFPEYNENIDQRLIPVLGGFGALGNPASFHNPFARKVRTDCYNIIQPLLSQVIANTIDENAKSKYRIAAMFDRMMLRRAGQKPMAEAWHRDVMKKEQINEKDIIYGGWVNLDSEAQCFSCITGSHLGVSSYILDAGFSTIEKIATREEMVHLNEDSTLITVLPGEMIIFPQILIHELVAIPKNYDMHRLFTSWGILSSDKSIYVDKNGTDRLQEILENQSVPQLPGGMMPPIYSLNHMRFANREFTIIPNRPETKMTLAAYSEKFFRPICLIKKENGEKHVTRCMKSLKELNLKMYEPYTNEEAKIYRPTKISYLP